MRSAFINEMFHLLSQNRQAEVTEKLDSVCRNLCDMTQRSFIVGEEAKDDEHTEVLTALLPESVKRLKSLVQSYGNNLKQFEQSYSNQSQGEYIKKIIKTLDDISSLVNNIIQHYEPINIQFKRELDISMGLLNFDNQNNSLNRGISLIKDYNEDAYNAIMTSLVNINRLTVILNKSYILWPEGEMSQINFIIWTFAKSYLLAQQDKQDMWFKRITLLLDSVLKLGDKYRQLDNAVDTIQLMHVLAGINGIGYCRVNELENANLCVFKLIIQAAISYYRDLSKNDRIELLKQRYQRLTNYLVDYHNQLVNLWVDTCRCYSLIDSHPYLSQEIGSNFLEKHHPFKMAVGNGVFHIEESVPAGLGAWLLEPFARLHFVQELLNQPSQQHQENAVGFYVRTYSNINSELAWTMVAMGANPFVSGETELTGKELTERDMLLSAVMPEHTKKEIYYDCAILVALQSAKQQKKENKKPAIDYLTDGMKERAKSLHSSEEQDDDHFYQKLCREYRLPIKHDDTISMFIMAMRGGQYFLIGLFLEAGFEPTLNLMHTFTESTQIKYKPLDFLLSTKDDMKVLRKRTLHATAEQVAEMIRLLVAKAFFLENNDILPTAFEAEHDKFYAIETGLKYGLTRYATRYLRLSDEELNFLKALLDDDTAFLPKTSCEGIKIIFKVFLRLRNIIDKTIGKQSCSYNPIFKHENKDYHAFFNKWGNFIAKLKAKELSFVVDEDFVVIDDGQNIDKQSTEAKSQQSKNNMPELSEEIKKDAPEPHMTRETARSEPSGVNRGDTSSSSTLKKKFGFSKR